MKLTIITPVYKRDDLTKIVLNYYSKLKTKYNLQLLAVGSEGDKSKKLCESAGWNYFEFPNIPLSNKFNYLLGKAKEYAPDAVMITGSDDLISDGIIKWVVENVKATEKKLIGFGEIYIYSVKQKRLIYFKGYENLMTIGPGRIYSKNVLEKLNWKIWDDNLDNGLDTSASKILAQNGIKEKIINLDQAGGIMVDIKHIRNITPFEKTKKNFEEVDRKKIYDYFPFEMEQIDKLKLFDLNLLGTVVKGRILKERYKKTFIGTIGSFKEFEASTAYSLEMKNLIEVV